MNEQDRNEILGRRCLMAVARARMLNGGPGKVTIHVGEEVWDFLRSFVSEKGTTRMNMFYGFDITRETSSRYDVDSVHVRVTEVIA